MKSIRTLYHNEIKRLKNASYRSAPMIGCGAGIAAGLLVTHPEVFSVGIGGGIGGIAGSYIRLKYLQRKHLKK